MAFSSSRDPIGALRFRDYRLYSLGGFIAALCAQMLDVAVGWELYERTHSTLSLGYVGLVLAFPVIFFSLPAGTIADSFDRRTICLLTLLLTALGTLGLAYLSWQQMPLHWYYACLFFMGTANAFRGPAMGALLPQLVPPEYLASAVTWNSSRWQVAAMVGPALGGFIIAATHSALPAYLLDTFGALVMFGFLLALRVRPIIRDKEPVSWKSLVAGLEFVKRNDLIFATITLDMFAVLLGGATMLLPAFAKDIIRPVTIFGHHLSSPEILGWLRAAPSVGAVVMALSLNFLPPMRRPGKALLWAVAGFGIATIVFGLSQLFWISLVALILTGALDNISVVVRHTMVQVLTPDAMRGRVNAVNSVFIGTSNELGGFESGVAAKFLGTVGAVIAGGIGTIVTVAGCALVWPRIAHIGPLHQLSPQDEAEVREETASEGAPLAGRV